MASYDAGTWFQFDDSEIGGKGKMRPAVLVSAYESGPFVKAVRRSKSIPYGFEHSAHPLAHEPTCCIDEPGWIGTQVHRLKVDSVHDSYSCSEPDPTIIAQLVRS